MQTTAIGQLNNLPGLFRDKPESENLVHSSMDDFLASVEKQSYVVALGACKDPEAALDIVRDAMLKMVKHYAHKPKDQWSPLYFKILQNRIADQHRKRGFDHFVQWLEHKSADESEYEDVLEQLPSDEIAPDQVADSTHYTMVRKIA